jgi:predicted nuclease with TOPRIM domain
MDRLDELVTEHVKQRVLDPNRLSDLLTTLKAHRHAGDVEVQSRLQDLRSEAAKADEKIRRLYRMVEDGMTEMDELLAERLSVLKAEREKAKAALERAQFQTRPEIILQADDIQRFSRFMSEKITSGDSAFRRNYLRSIIEGVEVDDKVIRIHGSKSALEQAVTNGDSVGKGVRGFIRNWRSLGKGGISLKTDNYEKVWGKRHPLISHGIHRPFPTLFADFA